MDLSFMDQAEILEVVFPVVYSPMLAGYPSPAPSAPARYIEVEAGVRIACAFWASGKDNPTILYFHGNGETAADYDWIAPAYNQRSMNLFVTDYRGYGSSNGKPTISNMIGDAHTIFKSFKDMIKDEGFKDRLFVMGRSLGSMSAIEVAANYPDVISGLIIESGSTNNFRRLWGYLSAEKQAALSEASPWLNKVKIRQVHQPTLIIHGEYDQLVSLSEGEALYQNSGAEDKRILIIPGADHNNIMMVNQDLYFDTIREFVATYL